MKHGVLKTFHPMLGCDRHIPWAPGSPAPAPSPVPYFTFAPMIGFTGFTSTYADDFYSHYHGLTMLKITDIGPLIPHIGAPSILLPIEILMSSSKSYFGASRFQSKGKPIAVSLLFVVNLNLNCGTPVPTPTGVVIALTTHRVDMTWGDIISGLLQMAFDFIIMWALSKLGLKPGSKIYNSIAGRMIGKLGAQKFATAVEFALALDQTILKANTVGNKVASAVIALVGFLVGSPMGIDASGVGIYGTRQDGDPHRGPGDVAGGFASGKGEEAGQAIGKHLDGGLPNGYPKEFGTTGDDDL